MKDFKNYLIVERSLSERSVKSYLVHVKQFLEYVKKEPEEIDKADIISFVANLKLRKCSESTIALKIIAIRNFMKFLGKESFMENFKSPKVKQKDIQVLNREKIEEIFNIVSGKYKIVVSLMYGNGLRVSELINIKVDDIDFDNNKIRIIRKRGKEKDITISDNNMKRIKSWIKSKKLDKDSYLVYGNNIHSKITRQGINQKMKRIGKKLNIKNLHAHLFRHSIATEMVKNGINLAIIQKFLGHENIATTQKYLHLDKQDVDNAVSSLGINF